MTKDPLDVLAESTARYRQTEQAHEESRQTVVADVVAALRAGKRPTDVADRSPFTASHVRTIARDHGIEPAPRGGGKKKAVNGGEGSDPPKEEGDTP